MMANSDKFSNIDNFSKIFEIDSVICFYENYMHFLKNGKHMAVVTYLPTYPPTSCLIAFYIRMSLKNK